MSRISDLTQRVDDLEMRLAALEAGQSAVAVEKHVPAYAPPGETGLADLVGDKPATALQEAGYATVAEAQAADDDTLMAIPGVGRGTVNKLRS